MPLPLSLKWTKNGDDQGHCPHQRPRLELQHVKRLKWPWRGDYTLYNMSLLCIFIKRLQQSKVGAVMNTVVSVQYYSV